MTCAQILKRPDFDNTGAAFDWEIKNNQVPYELPIVLPKAAWRDLPDALSELTYGVQHAQAALAHIHETLSQSLSSDPALTSIIELAGRGLKHLADNEAALVADVERVLRNAVSQSITDEITCKGKGRKS